MINTDIKSLKKLLKTKNKYVIIRGVDNKPKIVSYDKQNYITSYLSLKYYINQDGFNYKHILCNMFDLRSIWQRRILNLKPYFKYYNLSEDKVHVLDCGNGDCILLESDGQYAIIDFGSVDNYTDKGNNVYSYLKNNIKGNKIKYGIISHLHKDHIYDVDKISKNYTIESFKILKNFYYTKDKQKNLDKLEKISSKEIDFIDYNQIAKQQVMPLTLGNLKIEFIGPTDIYKHNINNNSFVLKVSNKENCLLLTGDIEKEAEYDLINFCEQCNIDLSKVNILKVAHHGSETSSTNQFLNKLSKEGLTSIVSSADNKGYNHPTQNMLKKLSSYGNIFTTFKEGNVVLNFSTKEKLAQSIKQYKIPDFNNVLNKKIDLEKHLSNYDLVNKTFFVETINKQNIIDGQYLN